MPESMPLIGIDVDKASTMLPLIPPVAQAGSA
jgi:hypothetical protein